MSEHAMLKLELWLACGKLLKITIDQSTGKMVEYSIEDQEQPVGDAGIQLAGFLNYVLPVGGHRRLLRAAGLSLSQVLKVDGVVQRWGREAVDE